jgi:hypothetical protein
LLPAAFNLIEGIDVAAIEARIAKYQEENAEQIMINRARKVLLMVSSMVQSLPHFPCINLLCECWFLAIYFDVLLCL